MNNYHTMSIDDIRKEFAGIPLEFDANEVIEVLCERLAATEMALGWSLND